MLNVKSVAPICAESIIIDDYIAFSARFADRVQGPTGDSTYWRIGDFEFSILEIGIDVNTGVIDAVTLTSPGVEIEYHLSEAFSIPKNLRVASGMPVVELTRELAEPLSMVDYRGGFVPRLYRNHLQIGIEKDGVEFYLLNERVGFGVNSNGKIASIEVNSLTLDEVEQCAGALKYHQSMRSSQATFLDIIDAIPNDEEFFQSNAIDSERQRGPVWQSRETMLAEASWKLQRHLLTVVTQRGETYDLNLEPDAFHAFWKAIKTMILAHRH